MSHEVILPEMGEGVIEGTLTRWLVSEGDPVEAFDPVAEVETDKVTTEILSEVSGVVTRLLVDEGATVPVETVVATIAASGEEGFEATAKTNGQSREVQPERVYQGRISPVVGRIAAEHKIDLNHVAGTGLHGRITKRDILAYVEQGQGQPDLVDEVQVTTGKPLKEGSVAEVTTAAEPERLDREEGDELVPFSGMRRAIAQHMVDSKRTSPHVTTIFEFDFTAVARHRAEHKAGFAHDGARLTYTVYVISAVVEALREHRAANSVWTDEGILFKRAINVGLAVAIADGLIVPVIKHADGFNLLGLARAINDLADRARARQLRPDEVQGGTFSVTNHGTTGSLLATPIINQPQAGILGIGKIEKRVKVIDEAIAIRPLAYASFTFDHRLLDGATADAFVGSIKERIENWT